MSIDLSYLIQTDLDESECVYMITSVLNRQGMTD